MNKIMCGIGWIVSILFLVGMLGIGDFRLMYAETVRCSINGGILR